MIRKRKLLNAVPLTQRSALVQGRDHLRAARPRLSATATATASAIFAAWSDKLDYLQDLGVTAHLAPAVLPVAAARRRLRHRRLHRRSTPSTARWTTSSCSCAEAHRRGLRVITELVLNHTSDQHPWFQRARRSAAGHVGSETSTSGATRRSSTATRGSSSRISSPRTGPGIAVAGAYYWHRFLRPPARSQLRQPRGARGAPGGARLLARRWASTGCGWTPCPISTSARAPTARTCPRRTRSSRSSAGTSTKRFQDRMLLAEANQWPEDAVAYFGDGDECHMAFHFPLMPRLFMAIHMEDRFPIIDILRQTPPIPDILPVGAVPAQPRRADAGDGDRRGARLHVPRLRPGPAGADQPGHPPPAGAAAGQRPPPRSS